MKNENIERRSLAGVEYRAAEAGKPAVLRGYAAVFNKPSQDLGGFVEVIRKGAFTGSLSDGSDVLALVGHDLDEILARTSAGNLSLTEDDTGLFVEITLANTTTAEDLAENVRVKNIKGMSFGFVTKKDAWTMGQNGQPDLRELIDVELIEVSATANPAYLATSVDIASRSRPAAPVEKPANSPATLHRLNDLRLRLLSL